MDIQVTVVLDDGDSFAYTADQAAAQVIAALGGNPTNDHAIVTIRQDSQGEAGVPVGV